MTAGSHIRPDYDRYGNRSGQSIYSGCTGITCPTNSVTISATTNQITGSPYAYDASGDMTNDGVNTLTYDGEARAVAASGSLGSGTYTVDGNGLRVKKVAGSTTTVYIFSGSKVIAEYQNGAAPSAPTTEYIYAGGALLAKINSSGTFYYHQDHLSNRYVTNSSGGKVAELGHFPFGESWYNATSDKLMFTTYERDSESGNDYAMARYHVSRLGRLSSPDPLSGSTADPQSLNRYSYSTNDPANLTDPSGALSGCHTVQERVTDDSETASGHGPSAADSDEADAGAQVQSRCSPSLLPGGGVFLDGADITDNSGALGMGFTVGGGAVVLGKQEVGDGGWQWIIAGYWPTFAYGFVDGGAGGGDRLARAKRIINQILSTDNDCSKFFNSSFLVQQGVQLAQSLLGPVLSVPTTAAGFFQTDDVRITVPTVMPNHVFDDPSVGAATQEASGANSTIFVNSQGFMMRGFATSPTVRPLHGLGTYGPAQIGTQVIGLLHELAHSLFLVPPDFGNSDQSQTNTQTILTNCLAAIKAALNSGR